MAGGGNLLIDALIALACISAGLSLLILIDQYRKEAKDNGAWGVFADSDSRMASLRNHIINEGE